MFSQLATIHCPSCYEGFEIQVPPSSECPCELDYDCEVCCSPMTVAIDADGQACALSLDEL